MQPNIRYQEHGTTGKILMQLRIICPNEATFYLNILSQPNVQKMAPNMYHINTVCLSKHMPFFRCALNLSYAHERRQNSSVKFHTDDLNSINEVSLIGCYLRANFRNLATTNQRQFKGVFSPTSPEWNFSGSCQTSGSEEVFF